VEPEETKMTTRHRYQACVAATLLSLTHAAVNAEPAAEPEGTPLAWVRLDDAAQDYAGTHYLFLGDVELQLTIDAAPHAGELLLLRWGSKNDTREAEATVNGKRVKLSHGGYDGFRWLTVPVPNGVTGERIDVVLKRGDGKPAFLNEIRLATKEAVAGTPPDLKPLSHRATLKIVGTPGVPMIRYAEAFPDMRALWDREPTASAATPEETLWRQAERNARLAAEGLYRCRRYVDGWLAHADPESGLIPRNLTASVDFWNGRDSGADNYPFMVLTAALTDRPLMDGRLLHILRTETRLTCRVDRLPDDYSFSKKGWRREKLDLDAIVFEGAEYVKDGLLTVTEWLGPSPWSGRMVGIVEDLWKHAPVDTPFGKLPTLNFEVDGDLLQACSRLYWFTGDRKYLDWAIRLGDYYLLGDHHPTRDLKDLRLSDHGCEVINGLSELYVAVSFAAPEKQQAYREPLHALFDRILEIGRNEDGLLYTSFQPQTGVHAAGLCDTWGYNFDGFYTLYLLDKTETYRDAVQKALSNLKGKYVGAAWADRSADGFADSIEGALNLYNREPVESAADWIDSQTRLMWGMQQSDGVIEGWHGDGNVARTTLMYVLWKTQGVHVEPWRPDVRVGAVRDGAVVLLSLTADEPWAGRLVFDRPRHKLYMHLPLDYPRINQFPEWFTTEADRRYAIRDLVANTDQTLTGKALQDGIAIALKPATELRWRLTP